MENYVDLSEEQLKEDVELQEVVEKMVSIGAEAIIADVKNDVSSVYEQLKASFERLFPFVVYWADDRALFWIDMQHSMLIFVLFVFFFWFLSPWQDSCSPSRNHHDRSVRGKNRTLERSKSTSSLRKYSILQQNNTPNKQNSGIGCEEVEEDNIIKDEVESELQKFANRWPTILISSPYRCLVLPPGCKRIDRQGDSPKKKTKDTSIKNSAKSMTPTDDNPGTRLMNYLKNIIHLFMLFRIFNFAGAGWTLIQWVQAATKSRGKMGDQNIDEYEEEDESVASENIVMTSSSNINSIDDETDIMYTKSNSTSLTTGGSRSPRRPITGTETCCTQQLTQRTLRRKKEKSIKTTANATINKNYHNAADDSSSCSSEESEILNDDTDSSTKNKAKNEKYTSDDDETLTKTPPQTPLSSEDQHFSTPTLIQPATSFPTIIHPMPITNGVRKRDALGSYRGQSFRRESRTSSNKASNVSSLSYSNKAAEVPVQDQNGYIVGDEFLPDTTFTPLLVFVNSRSGPQQGHLLTTQLRGLLNPIQIWDLADGDPESILRSFSVFTRLRILVCGGDGTVSWIVNTIDSMQLQRWPPIAILPLGTGNDLARIHGWGGGYNNESLIKILLKVSEGYVSWLDRWEMTIENKKGRIKSVKNFLNYLSVGADAQAALQVHMLRESRPQLFFSRIVNKAWYGLFGAEDIIKATSMNLCHDITLIADGAEVPLPADSQGIIMLNIDSYTGGVPLWADAFDSSGKIEEKEEIENDLRGVPIKRSKSMDDALNSSLNAPKNSKSFNEQLCHTTLSRSDSVEDISSLALTDNQKYERVTACNLPSSCQDGLLDIVSVRGTFHLGQIRVGLSTAQKLCQCREATIIIKRKVSVQIDGEPWHQSICTLRVRRKKKAAIMLHRSADESNGVEMEVANLCQWAENSHIIDNKVHEALMKEFSRRIESKTRQRRVQSNDNLMTHLKRAINSAGNNSMNHNNNIPVALSKMH